MSQHKAPLVSQFDEHHVSLQSYLIGFGLCVTLTLAAYIVATSDGISDSLAIAVIGLLALLQCFVQLRRFLHLGDELRPRLKLVLFATMLAVVLIFVVGSLWIMDNLNYRMIHSPEQMKEYIESQDGL